MTATRNKQRGAALVIGLILLVVITLLAVVGMNIANTELASATSEQLRLRAFNAAETGLEATMQTLADVADTDPAPIRMTAPWASRIRRSIPSTEDRRGHLQPPSRTYRGEGNMISRFSAGTFVGFHYSVESHRPLGAQCRVGTHRRRRAHPRRRRGQPAAAGCRRSDPRRWPARRWPRHRLPVGSEPPATP